MKSIWDKPLMWVGAGGSALLIIMGAWDHQPLAVLGGVLMFVIYALVLGSD